jgi:hypothetical protein
MTGLRRGGTVAKSEIVGVDLTDDTSMGVARILTLRNASNLTANVRLCAMEEIGPKQKL